MMTTTTDQLATELSQQLGAPILPERMRMLAGGASKQLWLIDQPLDGAERLVLIRPLGGAIKADALTLAQEYATLTAAHAAGIRTPQPLRWLPNLLGGPAALVAWVAGESIGRRVVREPGLAQARSQLPVQLGQALAAIHALQPGTLDLPVPPAGMHPVVYTITQIEQDLDRIGEPHPAIELGLRWLRRCMPAAPEQLVLLHGDFRIGNFLVNQDGLTAILDWEFAHYGDRYEDLAWPMLRDWRFGNEALRFGGIAPPQQFLEAYGDASGFTPDPQIVRYWEILGNLRWAVGCLNQAERHRSGQEPNLEFASLGRRAAEIELEAMRLIGTQTR